MVPKCPLINNKGWSLDAVDVVQEVPTPAVDGICLNEAEALLLVAADECLIMFGVVGSDEL